ncbi:hypothetical protein Droror1_Dr00020018 [Drosera rotundifolia]
MQPNQTQSFHQHQSRLQNRNRFDPNFLRVQNNSDPTQIRHHELLKVTPTNPFITPQPSTKTAVYEQNSAINHSRNLQLRHALLPPIAVDKTQHYATRFPMLSFSLFHSILFVPELSLLGEVGDGLGSREGGRGKGGRGRVGRGGRWRGRGRDGGVREREWRDDDRVRGRDDEDEESEDDLGWLDGPDNDVEAEKFAQKVGPEVMSKLNEIGFGVELSSIVTRVAAELKNGLVSCASECPVGFTRVEASKRCSKTYDLFDLLSGSFYTVMDCFCEKTWSHTPQYKIGYATECLDKVQGGWRAIWGLDLHCTSMRGCSCTNLANIDAAMFVYEPSIASYHHLISTLKITPFSIR